MSTYLAASTLFPPLSPVAIYLPSSPLAGSCSVKKILCYPGYYRGYLECPLSRLMPPYSPYYHPLSEVPVFCFIMALILGGAASVAWRLPHKFLGCTFPNRIWGYVFVFIEGVPVGDCPSSSGAVSLSDLIPAGMPLSSGSPVSDSSCAHVILPLGCVCIHPPRTFVGFR